MWWLWPRKKDKEGKNNTGTEDNNNEQGGGSGGTYIPPIVTVEPPKPPEQVERTVPFMEVKHCEDRGNGTYDVISSWMVRHEVVIVGRDKETDHTTCLIVDRKGEPMGSVSRTHFYIRLSESRSVWVQDNQSSFGTKLHRGDSNTPSISSDEETKLDHYDDRIYVTQRNFILIQPPRYRADSERSYQQESRTRNTSSTEEEPSTEQPSSRTFFNPMRRK